VGLRQVGSLETNNMRCIICLELHQLSKVDKDSHHDVNYRACPFWQQWVTTTSEDFMIPAEFSYKNHEYGYMTKWYMFRDSLKLTVINNVKKYLDSW
jgi:hypothetical protein